MTTLLSKSLVGAWLGPQLEELELVEVLLVKLMKPFVLKLAYLKDSEVDGSERRTAAHQVQRESPFWHSLLLLIPC